MTKKEASALIAAKLVTIKQLFKECEQLADEAEVAFTWRGSPGGDSRYEYGWEESAQWNASDKCW